MRLVLIGTSGNQGYIFASNRLREAVGASYLLAQLTTERVREVVAAHGGRVLQSSSGNSLAVVEDEAAARAVVTEVTLGALREAPGLQVAGVSVPIAGALPTPDEVRAAFAEHRRHLAARPGAAVRHQRVPVVAACASTDAPARSWHTAADVLHRDAEPPVPLSAEVVAKVTARGDAVARIEELLGDARRLVDIDTFFDEVDWVGVVHADGNQLGAFFRTAAGMDDLDAGGDGSPLQRLSDEVRAAAEQALRDAADEVPAVRGRLPLVPLIVGGDDLTVLVDGDHALPFTTTYLRRLAAHAGEAPLVRRVLERRGLPALTAAAGVALVKPHFPFSVAYGLADELCGRAKRLVAAHSGHHGIDVHVLIDSTVTDLDAIRARYEVEDRAVVLTERPFLVAGPVGAVPPEHDWDALLARLRVVAAIPRGGDGAALTRRQLHAFRDDLRTDPALARRRLARLRERAVDDDGRRRLEALRGDDGGLVRGVLDLVELAPFVGGGAR